MTSVHRPMTSATTPMCTSRNARLTPIAAASMLVARPVAASVQKRLWRLSPGSWVSSSASGRSPATIMCTPSAPSSTNAIQWSNASTYCDVARPSSQPSSGVMASITPKIRPARSASGRRGRRIAAPLPIAAAKASVDMAKPMRRMDRGDIGFSWPGGHGRHAARPT